MDLTQAERGLVLAHRLEQAEREAARRFRLHVLEVAWRFQAWLDENGAGASYSTFCDDFGYYEAEEDIDRSLSWRRCCDARGARMQFIGRKNHECKQHSNCSQAQP